MQPLTSNDNHYELKALVFKPFQQSLVKYTGLIAFGLLGGAGLYKKLCSIRRLHIFNPDLMLLSTKALHGGRVFSLAVGVYTIYQVAKNVLLYCAIKAIERNSIEKLRNGIVLELKCSHESDA